MPSICVLIPAYNASAFIGKTLESVAHQTRHADQIVVIDDGSTDGTADVAETTARKLGLSVEIIRQTNGGPASARNTGLRNAHTALVALLDSDDLLLPHHLGTLGAVFDRHPALAGCFGDQEVFDENGVVDKSFLANKPILGLPYDQDHDGLRVPRPSLFSSLLFGNYIPTSGSILSVTKLREVGGYNEARSLIPSEDRELLARLSLVGPFAYYPLSVARKREHSASLTARRTVAVSRAGVTALLCLREAKLKLTADQQDSLNAALRASAKDLLYCASCDGVFSYLSARRWVASSTLADASIDPKDFARALLRSCRKSKSTVVKTA